MVVILTISQPIRFITSSHEDGFNVEKQEPIHRSCVFGSECHRSPNDVFQLADLQEEIQTGRFVYFSLPNLPPSFKEDDWFN
ncbi:hypothetical protein K1719_035569 [Acacia pycnantha]|nr:hypothetical protein K1719_035569 [Acacia pycnantha]